MKRMLVAWGCPFALAAAVRALDVAAAANMIRNPNFEAVDAAGNPSYWSTNAASGVFERSTAVVEPPANASLRFHSLDSKLYTLATQRLEPPLTPGARYYFGSMIKAAGLVSPVPGGSATVCVQWNKAATRQWYGGSFPTGPSGTSGWVLVSDTFVLPLDADPAGVTISVYVRPRDRGQPTPTGTAYFDNVTLIHQPVPALRPTLLSPVYRALVTAADTDPIAVRAHYHFEKAAEAVFTAAIVRGRSGAGSQLHLVKDGPFVLTAGASGYHDLVFTSFDARRELQPGSYFVRVEIVTVSVGKPNKTIASASINLTRSADNRTAPAVFIDQQQRAIVNGSPFFPIGIYFSVGLMYAGSAALKNLSESPLNFIMPYGEANATHLDHAHAAGLKVAYSLKDLFYGLKSCPATIHSVADEEALLKHNVADYRLHPAVLAWYINDELSFQAYGDRLATHQHLVEAGDPDHPTWQVLCEDGLFDQYMGTFDIIGSDPYPIGQPGKTAAGMREEVNSTVVLTDHARPVWEVVQAHNWLNYHRTSCSSCRTPSFSEMRSMAWQAITAGANGLIFYSYHDWMRKPDVPFDESWAHIGRITTEVLTFAPVLLSTGGPARRPAAAPPSGGPPPPWLMSRGHWLQGASMRANGGLSATEPHYMLFAVSDGSGGGMVSFSFADPEFDCKPGVGLTVRVVMPTNGAAQARGLGRAIRSVGCSFEATIPLLAAVGFSVEFA